VISSISVLFVEDSDKNTESLLAEFEKAGFTPYSMRVNDAENLTLSLKNAKWDIVILGYCLNNLGVIEALRLIRTVNPDIPVIAVSGESGNGIMHEIMREGVNDFVSGNNLSQFIAAVEKKLRYPQNRDEKIRTVYSSVQLADVGFSELHAVLDNMAEGLAIADAQGKFIVINKTARRIFDIENNAQIDKLVFWDLFEISDLDGNRISTEKFPLNRILSGEKFCGYEIVLHKKSTGKKIICSFSGVPVRNKNGDIILCALNITDITDKKQIELDLKLSEEQFRNAVENYPSPFIIYDRLGKIKYINSTAASLFHAKKDDIIGHSDEEFLPPETTSQYIHCLKKSIDTKSCQNCEIEIESDEGILYFSVTYTPIFDELGDIREVIGATYNITEQKKSEKILSLKNAQLKKNNMELDNFVNVASHDLRSPLNGIIGYMNIINRFHKNNLDSEGQNFFDKIYNSALQMNELIDDLLTLSRMSKTKNPFAYADIREIINSVREMFQIQIQELNAKIDITGYFPEVYCDPIKIKEVFSNLIGNAIKFSSKLTDRRPEIVVGYNKRNEFHEFYIKDNGIGIEKEFHDKIFNSFSRLHNYADYNGSGIGLHIVKMVVEEHGGKTWVESEKGKGSVFFFTIPKSAI